MKKTEEKRREKKDQKQKIENTEAKRNIRKAKRIKNFYSIFCLKAKRKIETKFIKMNRKKLMQNFRLLTCKTEAK